MAKKKKTTAIKSVKNIAKTLDNLYEMALLGEMNPQQLYAVLNIIKLKLDVLDTLEMRERIEKLEKYVEENKF